MRETWETEKVKIPGFRNEDITIPLEKVDSTLASETSICFKAKLSKTFMRKGNKKFVKHACPVQWSGFRLLIKYL